MKIRFLNYLLNNDKAKNFPTPSDNTVANTKWLHFTFRKKETEIDFLVIPKNTLFGSKRDLLEQEV